jgi:isopropylmalate/homocitrate/citramalate synthase
METLESSLFPNLPARVEVIDCTLRDGEQAPGVWFTPPEKLGLARHLDAAGVDVLDAGFPASCGEEIETLQEMRRAGLRARIGATARAVVRDVVAAERSRAQEVFLFMPTSDLRLLVGLGLSRAQAVRRLRGAAEEVVSRGMGLNIVAEDAYRADPRWLVELLRSLGDLVTERVVICDTVGAAVPHTMEQLVTRLHAELGPGVRLCAHCHNDFGLATANTLAAVAGGAASVTCTVNALGERAGNADLAEVIAALTHLLHVPHGVDPTWLPRLAEEVDRLSGVHSSPLKPVTGWNVYSHESGVHVDGMLKDERSYEFLPAAWTGRKTRYVLGKHSGVALIRHLLDELGAACSDDDLRRVLDGVKRSGQARGKREHDRMYDAVQEFRARALGGVSASVVHELIASDGAAGEGEPPR